MCYLYMRLEEEMQELSTYWNDGLRADTIYKDGHYGARFYDKYGTIVKTELYKGHSESYAESAAENYVFGIKKIGI